MRNQRSLYLRRGIDRIKFVVLSWINPIFNHNRWLWLILIILMYDNAIWGRIQLKMFSKFRLITRYRLTSSLITAKHIFLSTYRSRNPLINFDRRMICKSSIFIYKWLVISVMVGTWRLELTGCDNFITVDGWSWCI